MRLTRVIAGNKGFLIALIVAAWLGIEAGGKGTGLVPAAMHWLFAPEITRDHQGFHPVDMVVPRPKGPVRLTKAEAEAANARLAKAFGANAPRHERSSAMTSLYELHREARCPQDRSDLVECNKVQHMDAFFAAVLGAMHGSTEHLLWLEQRSHLHGPARDLPVRVALFAGSDGQVKIAFDLRKVKRAADLRVFTVRSSDMTGLRDLRVRETADGIVIIDEPGELRMPAGRSAAIHVYGSVNPPENGVVGVVIEGDLLVRQRFFSAVLGKAIGGVDAGQPTAAYAAPFEPREEAVHLMSGVSLRAAMIDSLGGNRAAKARISKMSVRSGRGSF